MVEKIFASLPENFRPENMREPATFYFSIDQVKKTVELGPDFCRVAEGRTTNADCVCKMPAALFLQVWQEGYRPGMKDFLSGAIKSNEPQKLKNFLRAFGKGG